MKWLSVDSFQVSDETPVRHIRGLTKKERKSICLMIQQELSARRKEIQKISEKRLSEMKAELDAGDITKEDFDNLSMVVKKTTHASVRLITNMLDIGINSGNVESALRNLTDEARERIEFNSIKIIIPDYDREKEYDALTEGEALTISNRIFKLSQLTEDERESFFSSSASPDPNTGNGLAKSAGNTGSKLKETASPAR